MDKGKEIRKGSSQKIRKRPVPQTKEKYITRLPYFIISLLWANLNIYFKFDNFFAMAPQWAMSTWQGGHCNVLIFFSKRKQKKWIICNLHAWGQTAKELPTCGLDKPALLELCLDEKSEYTCKNCASIYLKPARNLRCGLKSGMWKYSIIW